MNEEMLDKAKEDLKRGEWEIKEKKKAIKKREKEIREDIIKSKYSHTLIDEPITWISTPIITRFKKKCSSYLSIEPDSFTRDTNTNPMNVHSPKTHNSISITLPDTYLKFSGKVRVTIERIYTEEEAVMR